MGSFNTQDFFQNFMQFYGLGQQLGARYDLNQMRGQTPQQTYAPANAQNNPSMQFGAPQSTGYSYLGNQYQDMPTDTQMRVAQQHRRGDIFENRGMFDEATRARTQAQSMQQSQLQTQISEMNVKEKKQILEANKMLTQALDGDTDALAGVLKSGAKYVTNDNTPMTVNLSEDGTAATFQVGQGQPVTKKLAELSRGEISAIVNRVRPGVLANASPQYAALAQQDFQATERFGLANQQFKQQTDDAAKRFNEQVRQFNTNDERQRSNAKAQQNQWLKQNDLAELRFDLADESFQHNRAMDLEKLRKNEELIDARIKDMQRKLRPAEWQYNWSVIRDPNSSPLEFALAAGIKVDDLANPLVMDAIVGYQSRLAPIGPLQQNQMPNQQIRGLPQNRLPPTNVNPRLQGLNTIGVPG